MTDWHPIETAPKDRSIILYGECTQDHPDLKVGTGKHIFIGFYDEIDEWVDFCSTWAGPFFAPTHWMPLPKPPKKESEDG